jgi:uncharacterized protein YbaA (DUF1428 family)
LAKYVDGFVFIVAKDKIEDYEKMAKDASKMWIKYGALEYMECMGDDLKTQEMGGIKSLAFTELAKAEPNETVWFSFIVYKSKKDRDEINAKVMEEMNKQAEKYKDIPMPFDMKRMAIGGFEVKVEG